MKGKAGSFGALPWGHQKRGGILLFSAKKGTKAPPKPPFGFNLGGPLVYWFSPISGINSGTPLKFKTSWGFLGGAYSHYIYIISKRCDNKNTLSYEGIIITPTPLIK